jgi:hypothetical protein
MGLREEVSGCLVGRGKKEVEIGRMGEKGSGFRSTSESRMESKAERKRDTQANNNKQLMYNLLLYCSSFIATESLENGRKS